MAHDELQWFKSSYSPPDSPATHCVEMAHLPGGGMAVRDSKAGTDGPVLTFGGEGWDAFLAGVQGGEFG